MNCSEASGQTVIQLILSVIPRYSSDTPTAAACAKSFRKQVAELRASAYSANPSTHPFMPRVAGDAVGVADDGVEVAAGAFESAFIANFQPNAAVVFEQAPRWVVHRPMARSRSESRCEGLQ